MVAPPHTCHDATVSNASRSPLELLGRIGHDERQLAPGLRLVEAYTMGGLLQLLWSGDPTAEDVVICCPGAMGGLLGPARGLFLDLGRELAERGVGVITVDYRRPDLLDRSYLDAVATFDWAARQGARRVVYVGHSFGGAVAIQAGATVGPLAAGVCTLSTQSAGCENAAALAPTPLLLLHGDRDQVLTADNSAMVQMLAGYGDLEILAGGDHGLATVRDETFDRVRGFIDRSFDDHRSATS